MKKLLVGTLLFICVYSFTARAGDIWQRVYSGRLPGEAVSTRPSKYLIYSADEQLLKARLNAQARGTAGAEIALPMPDGTYKYFSVTRASILPNGLAEKYPELKTYNAVEIDNPRVTAKLDFTGYGFHAMIFDGANVSFIDPADNEHNGYYAVHAKRDETRPPEQRMKCLVPGDEGKDLSLHHGNGAAMKTTSGIQRVSNGYELRTYRLALSCDHQYAQAVTGVSSPSVSDVLGKMLTTMNRVNGIYEKELSITMVFVEKEDTLIFTTEGNDPFGDNNSLPSPLLFTNQKICDSLIGTANYDIGHIFSTGAGGLSQLGVVCDPTLKAQSVTGSEVPLGDGFDVDYVAHEMGHEFGSQHTFNNNSSSFCSGNAVAECAYEPGSGSTIMCYAGICSPDNLQPHSDAYFSASSLIQIQSYVTSSGGCGVKMPTGNKMVNLPSFSTEYNIPYLTPFELTAPTAIDSANDTSVTYCWEEWDLGDFGATFPDTHVHGPIFRSYTPTTSETRVFPNIRMVLAGILSNEDANDSLGEKAPDKARALNFRLTVRNISGAYGSFLIPQDSIHLNAINTGKGFTVTSQGNEGMVLLGKTQQTVTWDVVHTNEPPISDSMVDIYMSADSGKTWAYYLGSFPNTGTASVMLPNPDKPLPAARIKVKGAGNVFFNVNAADFRVERNFDAEVKIFPVPAQNVLHIQTGSSGIVDGAIYNAVGQRIWKGVINTSEDIPVSLWARGVYFVRLSDSDNRPFMRRIVVE